VSTEKKVSSVRGEALTKIYDERDSDTLSVGAGQIHEKGTRDGAVETSSTNRSRQKGGTFVIPIMEELGSRKQLPAGMGIRLEDQQTPKEERR